MGNQTTELAMPNVGGVTAADRSEFIFPPPPASQGNRDLLQWLLFGLMGAIVILFIWTCRDFYRTWQADSAHLIPAMYGLLGLCLASIAAATSAVMRSRQTARESARLMGINDRLIQERDLLRTIIDSLPDLIYAKDRDGKFLLNNPAHAANLGVVAPKEMKGKSDFDFFPQELAEQFFADEQRILATGESVINQEQYKVRPGAKDNKKRWSLTSKVIWHHRSGEILGTVGVTRDIDAFKQTQEALRLSEEKLRQFTAQLEQSNRELQDFAYVASHDLQEPLRKIVVFGERLKEKCGDEFAAEPRDYVERMQKAAARMQTLINDLLTFSRLTTKVHPFVAVNLTETAEGVLEDLESRLEQVKGRVEVGILPVIDADGLQMRQLLQNLIGNALKFHKPGASPVVKVDACKKFTETGQEVCELTVSDNGIGFDEKYLDRIFNVFQRLHARNEYEGTGMGLAIVRKIALHHGGSVTAKSQPGKGATFIVTLPVTHAKVETNQPVTHHEN